MHPEQNAPSIYRAIALTLVSCAVSAALIATQITPIFAICAVLGVMCLYWVFRFPSSICALLIITYPLEWSKTFFPFLLWEKTIDGASVSIVDLFRLTAGLAILVWVLHWATKKRKVTAKGPVAIALLMILGLHIVSALLVAQAPAKAWIETLRLAFHVGLFAAVVHLLSNKARFQTFARTLMRVGLVMGLIGIVQFKTGWYIWNTGLENYEAARVNATFTDPNIFARFLIVVIVFYICLRGKISLGWSCKWLTAPVCVFALMCTFSRSGIVVFMVALLMLQLSGMIGGSLSARAATLIWLGITGLFTAASEAARTRLEVFSSGVAALGARVALIVTAWKMFTDHLIWGAGVGSFEAVALRDYAPLLPYGGNYVTVSHTAAMTIAAEQGLIGLALSVWFFITLWHLVRRTDRSSEMWRYATAGWISIVAIIVSAQSEGLLFDEPLLFILAGLIVAAHRLSSQDSVMVVKSE